jgi:hypothetical protein
MSDSGIWRQLTRDREGSQLFVVAEIPVFREQGGSRLVLSFRLAADQFADGCSI